MVLRAEIFEQPAVVRSLLESQLEPVQRIAEAIRQRNVAFVFLAARGSSGHAGAYAQYLWGMLDQLPVALAAPSMFTLYQQPPRLDNALVVGISQSGQSPDIVSVIEEGRRQGALTLAITNDRSSPLASKAEFVLDISAGVEQAVAATKTYTSTLMAIAMLSAALEKEGNGRLTELRQLPETLERVLEHDAAIEQTARYYKHVVRAVVLGRGYNHPTAMEWALKLKELTYLSAEPFSGAEFQHGPIAVITERYPVLAVAPSDAVLDDTIVLLKRLYEQQHADVLVISDDERALALSHQAIRLPSGVPGWLSPIVAIVPAQLFCFHLTRIKGYDTEQPRGLHKVTLTH